MAAGWNDLGLYEHYGKLIASLLPAGGPTFQPVAEDDGAVQVERGIVLPLAVLDAAADRIARVTDRLFCEGQPKARVIDAAGHTRPPYPGLLVYAWSRALEVIGRGLPREEADPRCPSLARWRQRLGLAIQRTHVLAKAGALPGADSADAIVDLTWSSLGCGGGVGIALSCQQPNGAFFPPTPSANPESFWYLELALLHAVAAYGKYDPAAAAAASRNAEYHLYETQPDHATNEPWGLLAFILNPNTHSVADQMLHTVRVQHPAGAQGVTAILLADVLDRLRELGRAPR